MTLIIPIRTKGSAMRPTLALVVILAAAPALAATITTSPGGGPWHAGATWQGGVIPTAADDVVIGAPVSLADNRSCASLTITPDGSLVGSHVAQLSLTVAGDVTNHGSVTDSPLGLDLRWGGDLHNAGTWQIRTTTFVGQADATISHQPGAPFITDLVHAPGSGGPLVATTPLTVAGDVDLGDAPLVLQPDCPLTMNAGLLGGEVLAQGNEIRFESWSYLADCLIDDAVLVGEVEAAFLVRFTTRVTVTDVLQNATITGGGAAIITGDLINLGTIRNNGGYGFTVQVSGDVHTEGDIACSQLSLTGVGVTHELSMGPDAVISADVFLPEFQPAALRATTPVRFADTVGVGVDGRLELAPGASVTFLGFAEMNQGHLIADGNEVRMEGNGGLSDIVMDTARLVGPVPIHGDITAVGGLEVAGTLTSWTWAAADLSVEGTLRNLGSIEDGANTVAITARGDVDNLGVMTNATLAIDGMADQRVAIGDGIDVAQVILVSNLPGGGHQWYRDGAPLAGQTGPALQLAGLGLADLGAYHCEAGGQASRTITVQRALDVTDVPAAPGLVLAQNRPNPFNPATEIVFAVERDGPIRLTVYDIKGRQVARLVDRTLPAGQHVATWQPRDLASGTYVYRLQADGRELAMRAVLVK